MEGNHTPFGPGSRHRLIRHHQHGLKGHQSRISPETKPGYTPSTSRPRVQPMGQRRRSVGPVGGQPTWPWAPPPQIFDVAAPHWMEKSVPGFPAEFTAEERVAPLYIYEGMGSISIISSPSIKLPSHSLKM